MEKLTKGTAILLLKNKYAELEGTRYPCRADFTESEVMAIKAHLGPWPRALEAAEIKPPRADDKKQRMLEKRIRQKRMRAAEHRRGNVGEEPAVSSAALQAAFDDSTRPMPAPPTRNRGVGEPHE